ncbi:MAG: AMP-binding protein [Gemmatimonadetes bacterium]|nr:AMP-binding protein [Gemmatimonadota bacterium]
MSLTEMFNSSLIARAEKPALEFVHPDGTREVLTFGEINARADRMAAALSARDLRAGDRCVVHLANCVEFIELFLACLRLGVIFVPVNVMYRGRELSHIVEDSAPALIVTTESNRPLFAADAPAVEIEALAAELGSERAMLTAEQTESATALGSAGSANESDDAPAIIIYTSGTTGRAKGAVLSRGNLRANAANLIDAWKITADDRYLAVLPLFHVHGLGNGVCSWLGSGCLMRLTERFEASRAVEWFDDFRPTMFFGVPTIYLRMLEWSAETTTPIGSHGRIFISGSAPLPAHVHEAFAGRFGHTILERYGMSETLMSLGNPYDGERRAGSVGVPFANVHARIVDSAGSPVADGTTGELEVRGPNVFAEYWRNGDATARAFRDGWFRTGDIAERSADGYYTLRGRATDLIISGGFNIYPREIEDVLLEMPGVREVAVVGAPDRRRGEVPIAYVVTDGGVTDDTLRDACSSAIASFKVPRAFVRVDALPRTALGKIQKHLLPPWTAE